MQLKLYSFFLFSAFWLRVTTVIFFLTLFCLFVGTVCPDNSSLVSISLLLFSLGTHIRTAIFFYCQRLTRSTLSFACVCVCVSRSYEFLSIPWLFYSTTRRIRRLISLSIKYAWTDRAGLYWISKHRNWYIEQLYFLKLSSFYRK